MNPMTLLVATAAVAAGIGGGTAAYRIAASPGVDSAMDSAQTSTDLTDSTLAAQRTAGTPAIVRGTHFRWAPCTPPATLQGRACVTEVVRTLAPEPAPAAAPAPAAPAAPAAPQPATAPQGGGGSDDGAGHDRGDDHGGDDHGGDDHGDDHGGDDD